MCWCRTRPIVSERTQHRAPSICLCIWHHAQSFADQGAQMVLAKMTSTLIHCEISFFIIVLQSSCRVEWSSWRRSGWPWHKDSQLAGPYHSGITQCQKVMLHVHEELWLIFLKNQYRDDLNVMTWSKLLFWDQTQQICFVVMLTFLLDFILPF